MENVKTKRGVAYLRVSTYSDSQLHSFEMQENYWREAIGAMPGYELTAIFADRGISGKSQNNRKQFQNMLEAARRHEFDTVFTKSVARLGRNAEQLLNAISALKECGVNVIFESEGIDTATAGSELYLTIAAAIAEDQLRSYSKTVSWALRDKFRKGQVVIGRMYGYRLENGKLEIVESEAEVIRLIFYLYLNGYGKQGIANELTRRKIPTMKGRTVWSAETICTMLKNEKYAGRLLQQKSVTVDGKEIRDQQILPRYYSEGTHDAIISAEDFDKAQQIREERLCGRKPCNGAPVEYPFRSKIFCGHCGSGYVHKINSPGTKYSKPMWRCLAKNRLGKDACRSRAIFDEVIEPLFLTAYNEFVAHKAEYTGGMDLLAEKGRLIATERKLEVLSVKGLIGHPEYKAEKDTLLGWLKEVNAQIRKAALFDTGARLAKPITAFDGTKAVEYLDRAEVKDSAITVKFINGYAITLPFSNGSAGNQKGWKEKKRMKEES
jgi:DNA invertase Pin-like site-specific DNA recombinase